MISLPARRLHSHSHDHHNHDAHHHHADPHHNQENYSIGMQVAGMFIIVIASILGMVLSFGFAKLKNQAKAAYLLLFFKSIGCGIIVSTAMIHLVNEASHRFHDSTGIWKEYDAWQFVFAQIGILMMAIIEFCNSRMVHTLSEQTPLDPTALVDMGHAGHKAVTVGPADEEPEKPDSMLVAYLTEASISVHSIFIGFGLGMRSGSSYTVLLVALSFHQFFEGFALGQLILDAQVTSIKKLAVMTAIFSLTTAIGIIIGICTRSTYDEESQGVSILLAIVDSICGGNLIYLGLVQMLQPWVTGNHQLIQGHSSLGVISFIGVSIGMAIMSIIGIWA